MMQINHTLMGKLFDYNNRVGTASMLQRKLEDFSHLAQNGDTPETRQRYAQAVKDIQDKILPQIQHDINHFGQRLGLNKGRIGHSISPEELKENRTAHSYKRKKGLLLAQKNSIGDYVSTKT